MNYKEAISYLYTRLPVFHLDGKSAYKPGLENVKKLDTLLANPHENYKTIHVAGTNGKGSVSSLLASVLQHAGYNVGLYTSPHLKDFRERIRINGKQISEDYVCDFVIEHKNYFEELNPSFFELTMSMAFRYFADKKVDIAIIEVGLGGRLDSTNIISPIISIITNISLDHQEFLGKDLQSIAKEKAGIIKTNTPTVIGEAVNEIKQIFIEKASKENSKIIFSENENPVLLNKILNGKISVRTNHYTELIVGLSGNYQLKNISTTLTSIQELNNIGLSIPNEAIYKGFETVSESTGLQGRWQKLQNKPTIICDTGHNEAAIKEIVLQLKTYKYKTLRIILGLANDKDYNKILSLMPTEATYYFCKANISRALEETILQEKANKLMLKGNSYSSVTKALQKAKEDASTDDLLFIGGSNFVVAEVI